MNKGIIYLMLITVLTGCFSLRKTSHERLKEEAPEWVLQTPGHSSYYHGVGVVAKNLQFDYRERARQLALNELAGNISVNVSSASVLNSFEFNHLSGEFFRDKIKMSTQEYLEGYELVETWENDQQYWVYYRLSKSLFRQIKQERISKALSISLTKFEQARDFAEKGQFSDALGFYVRAFTDISDFVGEELTVRIDGEDKPYATTLIADMSDQIQNLSIKFPLEKLIIKPGTLTVPVQAMVVNQNSQPVSGVPVVSRFSWLPGRETKFTTDAQGRFRVFPDKINPEMRNEHIVCFIDLDKIVQQNSSDAMVQKFFEVISSNTFTLPVEIIPPVFYVSVPSTMASVQDNRHAESAFKEKVIKTLREKGFRITEHILNSDYKMVIHTSVSEPVQHGSRYSGTLMARIELSDAGGNSIRMVSLDDISGIGETPDKAIEDAFSSLISQINISVFPEIIQPLFW